MNAKSKSSSTEENLGIDFDTFRRWIELQMTPEMNWSNIEIHHVKANCINDVSKVEKLREAFNWKNSQPFIKHDHQKKGIKINFLD